jgi:hypothetical protein
MLSVSLNCPLLIVPLVFTNADLSPFIRYDFSRIKMKANDVLTNSETATDEASIAWYPHRLRNQCLWQCDLACLSQGQSR